jgi:hypothetical protein
VPASQRACISNIARPLSEWFPPRTEKLIKRKSSASYRTLKFINSLHFEFGQRPELSLFYRARERSLDSYNTDVHI